MEGPVPPAHIPTPPLPGVKEVPFGVNEVRLSARQWLAAGLILCVLVLLTPRVWPLLERFHTGADYRLPYQLSKDYWLYHRWLTRAAGPGQVVLLGDSVVWGEYVLPDGTLSHFLNQTSGSSNRFVNGGINGVFPLAEEGLVRYYGGPLRHQRTILQCNVLWMTSPKADLSTTKEEVFNHSRLVPQFVPRIPCYRADANERLSAVLQNDVQFLSWVGHLQNCYFEQKSIPAWTLDEGNGNGPSYPNAYKNPFARITLRVPEAPATDPERGPLSPRHKPWFANGQGPTRFDWVDLDHSLQWQAFQRVLDLLRARGNDVLVVLGPFNEHMLTEDNRGAFRSIRDGIAAWLKQHQVPCVVPDTLPSALYADASHPLTDGYALLARSISADPAFQAWLNAPPN